MKITTSCFYCDKIQYGLPVFGTEEIGYTDLTLCNECLRKKKDLYALKIGER